MGKITTVDGLEMHAFGRDPGAAICDECGAIDQFGRMNARRRLPQLEKKGWWFSGYTIGAAALCPPCAKRHPRV